MKCAVFATKELSSRVTSCFRYICDQRGIAFPTHPISTHFGSSSLIFVLLALVVIEKLTVLSAWILLFCQVDNLVYML